MRIAPHLSSAITAAVGLAVALALTACGEHRGGLPDDPQHLGHHATATTAPEPETASPTTTAAPSVPVGAVPGDPAAAAAVRKWAAILVTGDLEALERACWTVAPRNVRAMYATTPPILAAIAAPGSHDGATAVWRGATTTVRLGRHAIAAGVGCPQVVAGGVEPTAAAADARHTVRRYLSRWIGKPVDAGDKEGDHPLVCPGSTLAANPGRLTGTVAFTDAELTSRAGGGGRVAVDVPVVNSSQVTMTKTFDVRTGADGYCIADVS